ncbi:MAG: porin family protein [Patiriisocius sp.]|uniref:porin family protein n=1 Tax=Patiriisocius sp. TaxID=2822396 RepID=UPI003EF3A0CA
MKKIILGVCLSIFAMTATKAQDLKFGVKAGLNVASIGGDAYAGLGGLDSRIAYHVGVFAEIPLVMKFSIQPELLYSAQGSQFGGAFGFNDIDDQRLNYINAPILVKRRFIKGLSGELGPVFGFLLSADGERAFNQNGVEVDNKEAFNDLDIGIAIGASYALDNGFLFGLRYNKGISNINNSDFTNNKNQNNVFQVWAGYSFL